MGILKMALVVEPENFQPLLRVLNTNVDGRHGVGYAITRIRGIGRRFANMLCKKADFTGVFDMPGTSELEDNIPKLLVEEVKLLVFLGKSSLLHLSNSYMDAHNHSNFSVMCAYSLTFFVSMLCRS